MPNSIVAESMGAVVEDTFGTKTAEKNVRVVDEAISLELDEL